MPFPCQALMDRSSVLSHLISQATFQVQRWGGAAAQTGLGIMMVHRKTQVLRGAQMRLASMRVPLP